MRTLVPLGTRSGSYCGGIKLHHHFDQRAAGRRLSRWPLVQETLDSKHQKVPTRPLMLKHTTPPDSRYEAPAPRSPQQRMCWFSWAAQQSDRKKRCFATASLGSGTSLERAAADFFDMTEDACSFWSSAPPPAERAHYPDRDPAPFLRLHAPQSETGAHYVVPLWGTVRFFRRTPSSRST